MDDKTIKGLIEVTKKVLIKQGRYHPQAILEERDKSISIVQMQFSNQEEKEASLQALSKMLHTGKFKSFLFISECWFLVNAKNLNVMPSESPNRQQGLVFMYKDDVGKQKVITLPFDNKDGKITFKKGFTSDDSQGEMGGRIPDVWN